MEQKQANKRKVKPDNKGKVANIDNMQGVEQAAKTKAPSKAKAKAAKKKAKKEAAKAAKKAKKKPKKLARHYKAEAMDRKKRELCNLTKETRQLMFISGNLWTCPVMLKKTLQLMLVSKRSFMMDFTLISS